MNTASSTGNPEPMHRSLWDLPSGQTRVIHAFADGLSDAVRTRLTELGFHPGARVTCLVRPRLGAPRVYQVSGTVYSLDRSIAARLTLHPAGEGH